MFLSVEAADNIILEHLREIRADLASLKKGQLDIRQQIISLRIHDHAREGDDIRRDQAIAALQADMDRVKRRLNLVSGDEG